MNKNENLSNLIGIKICDNQNRIGITIGKFKSSGYTGDYYEVAYINCVIDWAFSEVDCYATHTDSVIMQYINNYNKKYSSVLEDII